MEKRYNGTLLFALLSVMMFALGLQVGGFNLVIAPVAEEYQLSNTLMGSLATFQYIAIMIAPIVFGGLSDRRGRKNVIVAFSLLFLAGCAFTLFIPSVAGFIAGVFLIGAGASVTWGTISAALGDAFGERASKFINFSFCCYSLGAVVSPQLIAFFTGSLGFDWRICYILTAAAVLVSLVIVLPLRFAPQPAGSPSAQHSGGGRFRHVGSVIFISLFLSMVLNCSIENGLTFFANSYFTDVVARPSLTSSAISVYWLMMIPSRLLVGFLYKRRRTVLIASFICMAALLLVIYATTNGSVALVCMGAIGFASGPLYSTLIGLTAEAFPSEAGTMTGLIVAGQGIGGAASPFLMGVIADHMAVRSAYLMLALFGIIGAGAYLLYFFRARSAERQAALK